MNPYGKYFLNHTLWLDDGFCNYYLQESTWGSEDILDVESVVFHWPEEVEQWLLQCLSYDGAHTLRKLREFFSEFCMASIRIHEMRDEQVIREASRQICLNGYQMVVEPKMCWAVKVDETTAQPALPISVEPAPDLDALLADLKVDLDAVVADQQKKYNAFEVKMKGMSEQEKQAFKNKMIDGAVYDTAVGGTLDFIKELPNSIWELAKAFPGFYLGYLKTVWKVAQTPNKMAAMTAEALATGNMNPLKEEIDKIVGPVVKTRDQAMAYKSMLTILLTNPVTYNLLYDFAEHYWEATHPIERAQMGASAVTEVLVTILLAIVTAGAGVAVSVAAKSGKLLKIFKKLEKIATTLKKLAPDTKLPGRKRSGSGAASRPKKPGTAPNKGMPEVQKPMPAEKLDDKRNKGYGDDNDTGGPKTTPDKDTVTVYRVDDNDFDPRISSDGSVPIVKTKKGKERALFINVDQPQRAKEFATVNRNNNATITAVDADASLLNKLRANAVEDTSAAAKLNPNAPLKVDMNKAPDQFGLRTPEQIQSFRDSIDPSTVRIVDPDDL